ncbi:MAG: FAD binding domain-containing protein [Ignavibacteriaceae bacterium]
MTEEITFILNNELISVKINPAVVLLDFIRKQIHLTGTKEGCKEGDCGACTVLIGELKNNKLEYHSVNSCLLPLGNVNNTHIVTCRCTGYTSIKRSVNNVLNKFNSDEHKEVERISFLIKNNILPDYFTGIAERLGKLQAENSNEQNGKAKYFVAGGTDLYVQKPDEFLKQQITFIKDKNLSYIKVQDKICRVGAGTSFEMIKNSSVFQKLFPQLKSFMDLMASLPVRNSATIGGNIINASPIGDMTIFFLALNASIVLNNGLKYRKILLQDLFKGYKKLDKTDDEYLEQIEFKLPSENSHFNFEKVSKRKHLDIASVNSAIYLEVVNETIKEVHLSAGGVAPIPLYLEKSSNFLLSKKIEIETLNDVLSIIQSEISPISDIRGSEEYKRLLLNQLFKAHFIELFPELINVKALT